MLERDWTCHRNTARLEVNTANGWYSELIGEGKAPQTNPIVTQFCCVTHFLCHQKPSLVYTKNNTKEDKWLKTHVLSLDPSISEIQFVLIKETVGPASSFSKACRHILYVIAPPFPSLQPTHTQ